MVDIAYYHPDLGLFGEPLSEADQQKYNKEQSKETEADE